MELALLRYFIENPGRVIPRSELLENIWEMRGSVDTRAPDQFIRRLRKIFEPDSAQPRHFLTIRDQGYRFLPEGEISPAE
jgi:two-component system OmpR family response regulator